MGHFLCKAKTKLADLKIGDRIEESDFASITQNDEFVQLEYIEDAEKINHYSVTPRIWTIQRAGAGFKLEPTSFTNDAILNDHPATIELERKIDCFFNNQHVYRERKIEVPRRSALLYGPAGCHAKGSEILMFDGTIKKVEDVLIGDLLMGPDSMPRTVLKLARGRDRMLRVDPTKGESFIVNRNHMFHLQPSGKAESIKCGINLSGPDLQDKVTKCIREKFKLKRTGVDFSRKPQPIPPYILGAWLGDGNSADTRITSMDAEIIAEWENYAKELKYKFVSNKTATGSKAGLYGISKQGTGRDNTFRTHLTTLNVLNNKHVPQLYLTGDRQQRLELLAGLLDTDGHCASGSGFDFISKYKVLADQVAYLCRSLGLAAYVHAEIKGCAYKQRYKEGTYYRVGISGDCSGIPTRLPRKKARTRSQIKDVLRTGFTLTELPEDDYYGFTLDKDHLYLTADFTIHHNCGKSTSIIKVCNKYVADGKTAVVIWATDKFDAFEVKDFLKTFKYEGVEKIIMVAEDIGGMEVDQVRIKSMASLLSLLDNKEKTFSIPVFIIATTNHPENFLGNLTNRPGRFDDKIEICYPNAKARQELLKFFTGDKANEDDLAQIGHKKYAEFSAAHIQEADLRSALHSIPLGTALSNIWKEIEEYKKLFDTKRSKLGLVTEDEYPD